MHVIEGEDEKRQVIFRPDGGWGGRDGRREGRVHGLNRVGTGGDIGRARGSPVLTNKC